MDRRDFLGKAAAVAGLAVSQNILFAACSGKSELSPPPQTPGNQQPASGEVPYRSLGKTGEKVSALGLGGHHIGRPKDEQEGIRIVRSAIDRGITFMDNCWDYHNGGSEIRMGKALRDGYRQKAFLMTKIDGRTKESAAKQIDESLGRLQTDHVDVYFNHAVNDVNRMKNPEWAAFTELAKKQGKIRFRSVEISRDLGTQIEVAAGLGPNQAVVLGICVTQGVMRVWSSHGYFRFESLVLAPQRFKKWWPQQFHVVFRHHLFHFVFGTCAVGFFHLPSHLFKKLLESTGIADKNEPGFRCTRICPDVWSAMRQPDATPGWESV